MEFNSFTNVGTKENKIFVKDYKSTYKGTHTGIYALDVNAQSNGKTLSAAL